MRLSSSVLNCAAAFTYFPVLSPLPVYENATPLSLIILYGQNRTVYKPEQASVDHLFWQKNFDPLVFSRFQLALAVHYLYVSL